MLHYAVRGDTLYFLQGLDGFVIGVLIAAVIIFGCAKALPKLPW